MHYYMEHWECDGCGDAFEEVESGPPAGWTQEDGEDYCPECSKERADRDTG